MIHITCLKRTGSKAGSKSVVTFSSKQGFPKRMAFSNVRKKSLSDNLITSKPLSFSWSQKGNMHIKHTNIHVKIYKGNSLITI